MKKITLAGIVCTAVISFSSPRVALAEKGLSDSAVLSPQASISKTVSAFANFVNAAHVANGVALRNRDSGTIHLRGVPSGNTVIKAYLYWNFSDTAAIGSTTTTALFNGNVVIGNKRADSLDPCWGLTGNHTYRADVTNFVLPAKPNQDYNVAIAFNSATVTSGENPWLSSPGNRKLEGATLIVVFSNEGTAVALYDDLSGTEFAQTTLTVTLVHPISLSGTGLYTMSGADGQRGSGHDNFASNETGFFDGVQISGPPVAASDWDGAAGLPLPQLWDVHTHVVTYPRGVASSVVSYSAGADCLVPVVFVLQGNSP
jgi:hypothetical protein